jgi:hypothetical protein
MNNMRRTDPQAGVAGMPSASSVPVMTRSAPSAESPADRNCILLDHAAAHRSTGADLLVKGLEQQDPTTWTVDVALPRSHWLCHPSPSTIPLLLFVEAFRQAGITVCTTGMRLEPTIHFVISRLSIRTDEAIPFPRFGAAEYSATASFTTISYRKGAPDRLEVDFEIGDTVSAHFSARALRDADYRIVRRGATPLGEQIVEDHESLLLDLTEGTSTLDATLGVNEADPFFFDHPVDHIPGMLLVHAATSLHALGAGAAATAVKAEFPNFAELRTATTLHTDIADDATSTVISQGGRRVAEARAYVKAPDVFG